MPDVAEVRVVLKDGTVLRWAGAEANEVAFRMLAVEPLGVPVADKFRCCRPPPVIAQPQRRVVEILGMYQEYHGNNAVEAYISPMIDRWVRDPGAHELRLEDLLPKTATEEIEGHTTRVLRFRIEVEATEP